MRLSKIKLAGFKSFVDPTTLNLPSNLVGIVGPNGCGKSNTIDAVRWVMGESSAKHLRGASMDDVIFTGSTARKPVGQASVELVFDNSDGALGGEYAKYNEIAIRRRVTREGQSHYFLNNTRCRRRDITDIFLGTGLGPRSYAIIEQGMISRLIEAKPEELRVYLEEAAGISKYKERRRETENRIRHTRENLDRLNDLRDELEKQLERLKRQAATARRFKLLKEEERRLKAELLTLRYRDIGQQLQGKESALRQLQTQLEEVIAGQRSLERQIEADREAHHKANEFFNHIQGDFYSVGAEISRIEQSIQHLRETRRHAEDELQQAEGALQRLLEQVEQDQQRLDALQEQLLEDEPTHEEVLLQQESQQERLESAEESMAEWQQAWQLYSQQSAEPVRIAHGERSRMEQLESHIHQLQQRRERLESEQAGLDAVELDDEIETLTEQQLEDEQQQEDALQALEELKASIHESKAERQRLQTELNERRHQQQKRSGRLASLEALQQAALGQQESDLVEWLASQQLAESPRLAEQIEVVSGWERAVETVLGEILEAVCVDGLDALSGVLSTLEHGNLLLLSSEPVAPRAQQLESLLDKVRSEQPLQSLLGAIYPVESLTEALQQRSRLAAHESLITPEGLWIGPNWLRVKREEGRNSGVLARGQEIKELTAQIDAGAEQLETLEEALAVQQEQLQGQELQLDEQHQRVNQLQRQVSESVSRLSNLRLRREQLTQRWQQLGEEAEEVQQQLEYDQQALQEAEERCNEALHQSEQFAAQGEQLRNQQEQLREELNEVRAQARMLDEEAHQIALRLESTRSGIDAAAQGLERARQQQEQLQQRRDKLRQQLGSDDEEPEETLQDELESLLAKRVGVEVLLKQARAKLEEIDCQQREREQQRHLAEQDAHQIREQLEQQRLDAQESKVRSNTLLEQLAESGFEVGALLEELSAEASVVKWQPKVDEVSGKIQRLGAINLAAIDEFEEEQQRKTHLDAQFADITEALETLESAIAKIDKETRSRFRDTFEQVNSRVKVFFPRLFGGGHAHLELTNDDLLTTGVTIMARPPGKKVSTIHLLSGGEKALTAVALVFAFFELNPSPFCMLDEVDAPLDDANVGRFCELVKEMSQRVQFIFITHNKSTMELSEQLMGVTMHEAGVSRLVAVDVQEAAKLANG